MNHRYLLILLTLGFSSPLLADDVSPPTGFGVADWGMERNDIIAAEGAPNTVGDSDGYLMYFEKEVMGKKAGVVYNFEKGCSALKSSKCFFSDGYYSFQDGSKEFAVELEKILTEKYGPPSSVEKKNESSFATVTKGKDVTKKIIYTRYVGKVKIEHTSTFNLYEYTDVMGDHKPGPLRNFVRYYGPYHHEIEMNKKKAKQREL